jgi:PAS domain S-box-containing protein
MREVAARALRELRDEHVIATAPGSIEILDPARLAASLGAWQVVAGGRGREVGDDLDAVLEATPNASLTVGAGGEITSMNSMAEALFGWPRGELIGRPVEVLIPDRVRDQHVHHRSAFAADVLPRPLYLRTDLLARRRDGSEFPVWVGLSMIDTRGGSLVLATVVARSRD